MGARKVSTRSMTYVEHLLVGEVVEVKKTIYRSAIDLCGRFFCACFVAYRPYNQKI